MTSPTVHLTTLSVLLALTACGREDATPVASGNGWGVLGKDELKPHLTLSIAKSERLARIRHDETREHESAVYEVVGANGARLQRGAVVSPTVLSVDSLEFLGSDQAAYMASARVEDGHVLLRGGPESVVQSPVVLSIHDSVAFGIDATSKAYRVSIRNPSGDVKNAVMFWTESEGFSGGPMADRITDLEVTPDGVAVQYTLWEGRNRYYAVDKRVFESPPIWKQFSSQPVWAYLGKTSDGETVYISHKPGDTYDGVRDFHVGPGGDLLVYQGRTGKTWTIVAASRNPGDTQSTATGPFTSLPGRVSHHASTGRWFVSGNTADGAVLAMGGSGNSSLMSPAFKRLSLQRFETTTLPVATAESPDGKHVVLGTDASPAFKSISKLSLADDDSTIAYIGADSAGERVVVGTAAQAVYEKVNNYLLTTPGERPAYVGELGGQSVVFHEGSVSASVDKVAFLKTRTKDRVYWKAEKGEGELVGIDATAGKIYDKILSVQTTPALRASSLGPIDPDSKQTLWYDARAGESLHRVLETTDSPAYDALGKVVISNSSQDIIYAARTSSFTEASLDEEDMEKKNGLVSLTDVVVRNVDIQATYKRSMPGDSSGKKYLGDSEKDLPSIRTVSGKNHIYYTAMGSEGAYVGFNDRSDGPYDAISELKTRPDGSDVVYFAEKAGQWAVQEGPSRGEELDSVKQLRFTPDDAQVYYTGKREKTSYTLVGAERWLAVASMKLTPRGRILVYSGKRDDGWRFVVDGEQSEVFAKIGVPSFTDDDHGAYLTATREDKSQALLLKRYGKPMTVEGSWASVGGMTAYHNTVAQGVLVRDDTTGNYDLVQSDGTKIDLSGLPSSDDMPSFIAIGRKSQSLDDAWLIRGVESGQLKLADGPGDRALSAQSGRYGKRAFIQALYSPYSYSAKNGKRSGDVYAGNHYTGWEPEYFTANDRFHAIGRDSDGERFIIDEARSRPFHDIRTLAFHPEGPTNDNVAILARTADDEYEVALSDADASVTQLGLAARLESVEWTAPFVASDVNTVIWKGTQGGREFTAVHDRRYDKVRDPVVSAASADLSYVGYRNGLQSVYAQGEHGTWFSDVRMYGVDGGSGAVGYVGDHVYASSDDPVEITGPRNRKLSRIHVNGEGGPYVDDIDHLYVGASLASSTWTGQMKGEWALYTGAETVSESYTDIGWLSQVQPEDGEPSYHFLGRTADGWVEVHDGRKGTTVDAIVDSSAWTIIGRPGDMTPVRRRQDETSTSDVVFINEAGQFDYRGLQGSRQVLVHEGKPQATVGTVGETWFYADGEHVVYKGIEADGSQLLVVDGVASSLYKDVVPMFWPGGGIVYGMAELLPPEPVDEVATAECTPTVETFIATHAVLTNASESFQFSGLYDGVQPSDVELHGLGLIVETEAGWQAWVNGALGPVLDEPIGLQPVWGPTLGDTRYAGRVDGKLKVFSDKALTGPVDEVADLYRVADSSSDYRYNDSHFAYRTRTGHTEQQWVDDKQVSEGEVVARELREFDKQLLLGLIDANQSETYLGSEEYASVSVALFGDAAVLGLTNADKTFLDAGGETTAPRSVYWDVQLNALSQESADAPVRYELAWVSGVLDRETASVAVYIESQTFEPRDGKPERLRPLTESTELGEDDAAAAAAALLENE